jgi:CheY-like chemotaxis protein
MGREGAPLRVLVVDDNENFRRLVASILKSATVSEVLEARDGAEAVEMLANTCPHLALVDWRMGPMGGADFVSYVRTHPDSPNPCMPVIVLTGYTHDGLAQEVREVGADDFVAKPISPRTLMGRIMRVLQSPRPYVRGGGYLGPDRRRHRSGPIEYERRQSTLLGEKR